MENITIWDIVYTHTWYTHLDKNKINDRNCSCFSTLASLKGLNPQFPTKNLVHHHRRTRSKPISKRQTLLERKRETNWSNRKHLHNFNGSDSSTVPKWVFAKLIGVIATDIEMVISPAWTCGSMLSETKSPTPSTAQPRKSNPGPRLATVADAKALTKAWTGSGSIAVSGYLEGRDRMQMKRDFGLEGGLEWVSYNKWKTQFCARKERTSQEKERTKW